MFQLFMEGKYFLRSSKDPILRVQCVEVDDFSDLSDLLLNMREIMRVKEGVGLAAPQIGDNRRVAIAKIEGEIIEFINPVILKEGKHANFTEQECLSLPGKQVRTNRNYPIRILYQDRQGEYHAERFTGFVAVVLQHEIDHLEGILITEYPQPRY